MQDFRKDLKKNGRGRESWLGRMVSAIFDFAIRGPLEITTNNSRGGYNGDGF